jgi:hypothetical protein
VDLSITFKLAKYGTGVVSFECFDIMVAKILEMKGLFSELNRSWRGHVLVEIDLCGFLTFSSTEISSRLGVFDRKRIFLSRQTRNMMLSF